MLFLVLLVTLVSTASASFSFHEGSHGELCTEPSDVEVCLKTLFNEIESGLSVVAATLAAHEASIKVQMAHEHSVLHSQISWVELVESVASSVESAVSVDVRELIIQYQNLEQERSDIRSAYVEAVAYFEDLEQQIAKVINQEEIIVNEYNKVKGEKWSLYSAISAIVYEKLVIEEEQGNIEAVVAKLHAEMSLMYQKVAQLNKRQEWLVSWENQLYADVEALEVDVVKFRAVEVNLYQQELFLYAEQQSLLVLVEGAESCLESLEAENQVIQNQIQVIENYQVRLREILVSISKEALIFIQAYEKFTCEDSLLYYEVCSNSSPVLVSAQPNLGLAL